MDAIILQLLNGLDKGGAYALIALGLTLVFGTLGVVNFAHGALFMLGAFCAVTFSKLLTLETVTVDPTPADPLGHAARGQDAATSQAWLGDWGSVLIDYSVPLSILLAIPVMLLIGIVMERGLIRYFYKRPHADQILVTFGLAIVLQEIVKALLRRQSDPAAAPPRFAAPPISASGSGSAQALIYPWWRLIYLPVLAGGHRAPCSPSCSFTTFGMVVRAGMARPRDGRPARHQHRAPLHHRVRHRRGGRRPRRRDVHADRAARLSHGHGFPGAVASSSWWSAAWARCPARCSPASCSASCSPSPR